MTKAEVERIVAVWQERLGLSHWDIRVRWEMPVDKGFDAEIAISDDYDQASIRIQQQDDPSSDPQTVPFSTWSAEKANRTILHEFLHIFEKDTRRPASALGSVLPSSANELFWSWYQHGAEVWIEHLTTVIFRLGGPA